MGLGVIQIVPLIGEQHAIRLALAQSIGQPPSDMLVIVRIAVGQRRDLDELGATEPQRVLLFLTLGFRNDDQGPVTARIGDYRKTDPGVTGSPFHHQAGALQVTPLLGFEDHLLAGTILHRLSGIHELGLAENGAAGRLRSLLQLDEWRVADRFDDVMVDVHLREFFPVCCLFGNDPRMRPAKVKAGFS